MSMNDTPNLRFSKGLLLGLFAVTALALVAGGYWLYRREVQAIRDNKYIELKAIAELKVNQIVAWRDERLSDARLNSSGILRTLVLQWLKAPGDDSMKANILARLKMFLDEEGYRNTILASPDGRLLLSLDTRLTQLEVEAKELVAQAISSCGAVFGDFFLCSVCDRVHLDVAAPILDEEQRPVAALLLRFDPENFLYPLVQSWPTPSKSAETLLIRKDGDNVLFLNTLRHRPDPVLTLRIPMSHSNMPAVQAALGKTGVVEGEDYRGVDVVSNLRPVPGSPWFMVAKVDMSEVLAEARYRGKVILLLVAIGIVMTGFVTAFLFNNRQRRLYRSLYRAERKRWEVQEEIRATFYGIGDGVIATDAAGRVTRMNPVAESLTGWSEAEALGKSLKEVFRIVNEETLAEVESPVERVLREGKIVGLANHTALIARDGTKRPIADSGAPIRNERGAIIGLALVFRDQTAERATQAALQASEERYRVLFECSPDALMMMAPPSWKFTSANPATVELFGAKDEAELATFGLWALSPEIQPDGRPSDEKAKEMIEIALRKGSCSFEWTHKRLNGKVFPAMVLLTRMELAGQALLQVTVLDITERKRVEERAQEAADKTRRLLEEAMQSRRSFSAWWKTRSGRRRKSAG